MKQTDINILIGENLRAFRKLKGLSQQQFVSSMGMSYQQLQKYEKGQSRLRIDTMLEIAELLDINSLELFETITNNKNWEDFERAKDVTQLLKAWQKIDDKEAKKAFLRLLEIMMQ